MKEIWVIAYINMGTGRYALFICVVIHFVQLRVGEVRVRRKTKSQAKNDSEVIWIINYLRTRCQIAEVYSSYHRVIGAKNRVKIQLTRILISTRHIPLHGWNSWTESQVFPLCVPNFPAVDEEIMKIKWRSRLKTEEPRLIHITPFRAKTFNVLIITH